MWENDEKSSLEISLGNMELILKGRIETDAIKIKSKKKNHKCLEKAKNEGSVAAAITG